MTATLKIRALLLGCLLLIVALAGMQYDLVRNTYELTKRQYEADVRQALARISPGYVDLANQRMGRQLTAFIQQHPAQPDSGWLNRLARQQAAGRQLAQPSMSRAFRRQPILEGVAFSVAYHQILLQRGNRVDTLLRPTDRPVLVLGQSLTATEPIEISRGEQVSSFAGRPTLHGAPERYRLAIQYRQRADVTEWQQRILSRMSRTLIVATGLLVAVVGLFFSVFQTLFRQKKLADILTDFTNNMTHELKTPLTSVGIIIKSLKNESIRRQPVLVNELMQSLERQHQTLQALTDQVLASSLTDRVAPHWQDMDVDAFLREIVLDFRTDTHRLTTRLAPEPIRLNTDPALLRSVLDNLLDNAQKYSPAGTDIVVESAWIAPTYRIGVTDQGPGIAPRHQRRIFDKFYRVPEHDVHTVKGMGLGLYLCRTRIRQLGGRLWVRSALGLGSTFFIDLPMHGAPHSTR